MTKKEIFSKNLNAILESLQKTQIEVANAIGVSQQTFNTWCRGIAIPRMDKIQSLADYFHVPMASLIEDCNALSSSLSHSANEIAKAVEMYNAYEIASPEIKAAIDSLLKTVKPIADSLQETASQIDVPHLESPKQQLEHPYLKKDINK